MYHSQLQGNMARVHSCPTHTLTSQAGASPVREVVPSYLKAHLKPRMPSWPLQDPAWLMRSLVTKRPNHMRQPHPHSNGICSSHSPAPITRPVFPRSFPFLALSLQPVGSLPPPVNKPFPLSQCLVCFVVALHHPSSPHMSHDPSPMSPTPFPTFPGLGHHHLLPSLGQ